MKQLDGLKRKLRELRAKMDGHYETAGEQYESSAVARDYEVAMEQHANSKDHVMDLADTPDEGVPAEKHPFERSMDDKLPDSHGNTRHAETPMPVMGYPTNMVSDKNRVTPSVTKKLVKNAALMGMALLSPVLGLFGQMQDRPDFLEIACSANSALSNEMSKMGYHIKRANYLEGYDLNTSRGTKMLGHEIALHPPRFGWVSMPCTRLSSLVNLTPRSEAEWATFQKKQRQDLKRSAEVASGCEPILASGGDLAWEWPAQAHTGWKSFAIKRLLRLIRKHKRNAYWCRFDGCAYGLKFQDVPVRKGWLVLTTSKSLWMSLHHRCPGHSEHAECRGQVAQFSVYYPPDMVKAVVKAIQHQWQSMENECKLNMADDVNHYLLNIENVNDDAEVINHCREVRDESPEIFALTRNRFPETAPTGKKLDLIRQQMLRIHRASGHAPFSRLQKLLTVRKAPKWAIELAGKLECPSCIEAKQPKPASLASLKETPALFEIVGMDCFEFEHSDMKHKVLLMRDRASGFVMLDYLKEYTGSWEPTTSDIISAVCKWLMINPKPQWIISDSATYFTSSQMLEFYGHSGIGVLTTPAEAHEMLGAEEGCIKIIKETTKRLKKEEPELDLKNIFQLAAHAHNESIGPSGFSPFQWVRGSADRDEPLPGQDPKKMFEGLLKLKVKAKVAYEMESAKQRLSKLNNSAGRPPQSFKPGDLLMLWRQKNKPGKVSGSWVGPVRLLLQESGALWLATGSTLIRARTTQVRKCTKHETLDAMMEGTAVLSTPTTVETLLRSFTGKHYVNATGEVPSQHQRQDDVQGAEVLQHPPEGEHKPDTWKIVEEGQQKWLVRQHNLPRLTLLTPTRTQISPVPEDQLTGRRITEIQPLTQGSRSTIFEDDFKTVDAPHRQLQERWKGQTRFEIKPDVKRAKTTPKERSTRKRDASSSEPLQQVSQQQQQVSQQDADQQVLMDPEDGPAGGDTGQLLPEVPDLHPLTTALRERGPAAVDGVPDQGDERVPRSDGRNQCAVKDCNLPGGHDGPHEDEDGNKFSWEPYSGRINLESSDSDSSGSSDSSEELVPEQPAVKRPRNIQNETFFYALEIPLEEVDLDYLSEHPKKASIWLSKKLEARGKELRWSQMPLSQKKQFDEAQCKELSQVMTSKAVRSLTAQEELNVDHSRVMAMRWVMTVKSDNSPKARLVVLGYQQHNLTSVQAAAPTMSRIGRNMLLTLCACLHFEIAAGDVSAAFLQATQSLEGQDLYVWAPSELAVLSVQDQMLQ